MTLVVGHFQSVHGESAGRWICMVDMESDLHVMMDRRKHVENRRPKELSKRHIIHSFIHLYISQIVHISYSVAS